MLKYVGLAQYEPHKEPGPGTMGWMERQLYGDDVMTKRLTWQPHPAEPEPIGANLVRNPLRVRQ